MLKLNRFEHENILIIYADFCTHKTFVAKTIAYFASWAGARTSDGTSFLREVLSNIVWIVIVRMEEEKRGVWKLSKFGIFKVPRFTDVEKLGNYFKTGWNRLKGILTYFCPLI